MKKIYYSIALLLLSAFLMTAKAEVELATFEDPEIDNFDVTGYSNAANGSMEVVANPAPGGINTTVQCLKNNRKPVDWSSFIGQLHSSMNFYVDVNSENRYLHIMVYSEEAANGYLVIGTGVMGDIGDVWNNENETNQQIRFSFEAGVWKDLVIDLQNKVSTVYGFYFLSQDWSAPSSDRNFYYDEIVINNDPEARKVKDEEEEESISTAGIAADFETNIPLFENTGNTCSVIDIVDNSDNEGLNESEKTLYVETVAEEAEWWGGANLTFEIPFLITDENRYLHIMLKTDLQILEFNLFANDEEKWAGSFTPRQNTWYDYVVDLYNFNSDGQYNLSGSLLTGFRAVVYANEEANKGKNLYLDEIILDDNSEPRTVEEDNSKVNGVESLQNNIHVTETGVCIENVYDKVIIYDITGKTVLQAMCNGKLSVELSKGMYIVSINTIQKKVLIK